ncbi:MAG: acylphosphatase [Gammaproteobacteria bacterium]|nr:acylphosphatase [Gammaproteobacteria bacterium]
MKEIKNLKIFGRVQGVFFRESMSRKAQELGITGWVRNCRDGTVEAMIQGTPGAVAAMIEWAGIGPASARVERIDIGAGSGDFTDFARLDTD